MDIITHVKLFWGQRNWNLKLLLENLDDLWTKDKRDHPAGYKCLVQKPETVQGCVNAFCCTLYF